MSKPSFLPEPVFIVGMNGSGTTMLLDSLGRHPELYAFPRETRLIPHLIKNLHRFGDLNIDDNFHALWEKVANLTAFVYVNNNPPPIPDDWRKYSRDLASVLDGIFRYFAQSEGKIRWCEKTPQHVQHIQDLANLFPNAKFLHVVRDGRDCAASFNRRWMRTPELTVYRWKKVLREGRRQGAAIGPDRYLEIHYEDLTENPEKNLKVICAFLNIRFDSLLLQSSQPYLSSPQGSDDESGTGRLRPNSGNWRTRFSKQTILRLETICGSTLAEFGYTTSCPLSDYDPPKWRRISWLAQNYLLQYVREIALRLAGKTRKPWWVILSRPLAAYKQQNTNKH